jgi:POT family proton-dependent oligopeptide transporter
LLSIVYCLGHAALACMGSFGNSPWWLFTGLLLICVGSGGIKPCVSAHVGDQFGKKNHYLISRIYNWFYFSINFGSFFSTLLTPWLLEKYGPHWAFGVPGVLMAIATFMFWLGRKRFVHIPPSGFGFFKEAFSRDGIVALCKLIPLFIFIAVFWSLYDQTGSSWVLQAEQMNLKLLGITWLESQVQAVNPILILIFIPLFTFFIYPWINRIFPLTPALG